MTALLPEVERALLQAVDRHHRKHRKPRASRTYRAALGVALSAALATGIALATGERPSVESAVEHGMHPAAPAGPLRLLGGRGRTSLAHYRGQIVVVSFWAAWCAPCVEESHVLTAIDRELHREHEGTVALIAPPDEAHDTIVELERARLTVPVLLGSEEISRAYGTNGLPTTFVVDRSGRVTGFVEGLAQLRTLRLLVKQALR